MRKKTDINIKIGEADFACRSCAVVMHNDKILFQKRKSDKCWALPGGKIEVLETTKDAIARELKEELAITDIIVGNVISITENFFEWKGNKVHQYIFTHKVTFNDSKYNNIEGIFESTEKEKDVIYTWIKKEELKNLPVKPDYIVEQILNAGNEIQFTTCIE